MANEWYELPNSGGDKEPLKITGSGLAIWIATLALIGFACF